MKYQKTCNSNWSSDLLHM